MMDSPPQLSPPPELKSSLNPSELVVHELTGEYCADVADQSELVVRQLTGEHLVADNATEIDSREFRTRGRGQRENGEHEV